MTRIVAVTPLYPPASRVGAWLATHELLAHLARRGLDVTVYRRSSESRPYVLDNIEVRPGRDVHALDEAISEADLVVSHCGDDGMAHFLAREHDKPSVRMVHGQFDDLDTRLEGAALAVFNSSALLAESRWSGATTVIHPPARADVHAVPGDRVTLVNLSAAKGGSHLWQLAKLMPRTQFLGVKGGYGLQPIYRRSNVEVLKTTPRMARVYARTRVLLMPSALETFGLAGVEAMSCGIPVIAHPTPGLRESLGDAGIFVDLQNMAGWVAEIERLADPVAWASASAAGLLRAEELEAEDSRARFADALDALDVKVAA